MFKKLASKKGQIAMELGILVMAAVAVAAIAAYFYATNVSNTGKQITNSTNQTTQALADAISDATSEMSNISG
ncbi:class III signal peptide-containing protein [Methanococcus maripaludis]|uniref:Class III signal peptide-containing protein n=1 Tax=Methanococcus maripaludis TaxID=39152 RepID=A0A8T3W7N9_METMI|nr:class III signal peptide-containing protein [Methanococcus maripaludis]MBG0769280.1 class III signal peptide-containing protein [Methanococcus maripaludis]